MSQHRPLRADAARNRARILRAADEQIVAHGPEVPMEAIADAAEVAVGTLYRHFPTKVDLVRAVIDHHLAAMSAQAEQAQAKVEAGARAIDEIAALADRILEGAESNKAVKAAARTLGAEYDQIDRPAPGRRALERLIESGKATGDLREDLTIEDFYLFFATAPIGRPAHVRDRWTTLMLDGFRPPRGS